MEQNCAEPGSLGGMTLLCRAPAAPSSSGNDGLAYASPSWWGKALGPNRKLEAYNQKPSSFVGQGSATTL